MNRPLPTPSAPDYMVDYNPTYNADLHHIAAVPVRYGRVLQIGETAYGEYRDWTDLSISEYGGPHAANWMA